MCESSIIFNDVSIDKATDIPRVDVQGISLSGRSGRCRLRDWKLLIDVSVTLLSNFDSKMCMQYHILSLLFMDSEVEEDILDIFAIINMININLV